MMLTFDLVSSSSHGELVDASIRCPSVSNVDLTINDFAYYEGEARQEEGVTSLNICKYGSIKVISNRTLWLLEEEALEVIIYRVEVGTRLIRYGGEENGALCIAKETNVRTHHVNIDRGNILMHNT
jgi:hypothetical protein